MKKEIKKTVEGLGLKAYGDLVMINGELFPLPLVEGNSKIGNVWHASTMPTNKDITIIKDGTEYHCKGTCPLNCKGCYGTKGNYNYNSVKYVLMMRTRLLREYPEIYFALVKAQIKAEGIKLIRLHATGDFIKGEAKGWADVFQTFAGVRGWTYTKCVFDADIKALDHLPNFNIVKSIIKGCGFNFGHIGYILKTWHKLKAMGKDVYICRCGIDKNQHCDTCKGCASHEYVLFIEHSTAYKAIKDALYNVIQDIIESQPKQEAEW